MVDPMQQSITGEHDRRHFLTTGSLGLGSLATAWLLDQDRAQAAPIRPELVKTHYDTLPKPPVSPPRANAMISLWMQGGPSHIDLFDPKPEMAKWHMKPFPGKVKYDNAAQASSKVLHSPWKFRPRGDCGTEISQLLPHTADIVDDICLIRSMRTGVNNHGQSILALQTGRILKGRPSLGSWLSYGLGTETDNLPSFLALIDPGQLPVEGVANWSNGWLPAIYQGTVIRPREPRILNLQPPAQLAGKVQRSFLDYVGRLNTRHLAQRATEHDLAARIASYRLAERMQMSAHAALDISGESKATQEMYGIHDKATADYGTRCLIARRLVERGVRFIQVYTQNQFWDHHGGIKKSLPRACRKVDKPSAALVRDLKQRGLLDSTVVHWGGEMGRLPVIQNEKNIGRDHNTHGFSMWVAGGGFARGLAYGQTDDFGHKSVENVVNHYDYHATLMYLFGIDANTLTYTRNTREKTILDGQPGRIVRELLDV
ncbi:MAG: hypothetical protein CMJ65_16495 [Planctomycetaceae bacterium]|nr:hypothetical protein [Planctomycetaceae bacterium]